MRLCCRLLQKGQGGPEECPTRPIRYRLTPGRQQGHHLASAIAPYMLLRVMYPFLEHHIIHECSKVTGRASTLVSIQGVVPSVRP